MPGFTGWSQDKMNAMAGAGGYEAAITPEISREEALEVIRQAGLDEKIRGERLSLEELAALADAWYGKEQEKA